MIKRVLLLLLLTVLVSSATSNAQGNKKYPYLKLIPDEIEMGIGDSAVAKVMYIADDTTAVDTTAVWSAEPDTVFSVNDTGLVIGLAKGGGMLTAVVDTLMAKIKVKIEADEKEEEKDCDFELYVSPYDTIVSVGAVINYEVFHKSDTCDAGDPVTEPVTWTMEGMPVGSLSPDGVLTTEATGFALIKAELADGSKGSALIIVDLEEADPINNKITISKPSNNSDDFRVKAIIEEGGMWTIGGLPSPMNILNGGKLFFPSGSLDEDIRIHVNLPHFAKVDKDTVDFGKKDIVVGVDFQVFVDETLIEPYYFQIPFIIGLVYKKGLLRKLDIDPYSLALYFVMSLENGLEIDSSGISYVTVDPERNRIFASVAHMSTIAAMSKTAAVTGLNEDRLLNPADYKLYQNYPNPFNPSTNIEFYLPARQYVTLKVFDMLGREVANPVSQIMDPGHYNISFPAEDSEMSRKSSGIYFYTLSAGSFVSTKKMLLLK